MALGTGDTIEKFGTVQVLETNGGSITDGNVGQTTTNIDLGAAGADDVLYGSLAISGAFAANPNLGGTLEVYVRPMGIANAGAIDATAPSATYRERKVATFKVDSGGTGLAQSKDIELEATVEGQTYEVYLRPNAGVTWNAAWRAEFTPKAIGAQA